MDPLTGAIVATIIWAVLAFGLFAPIVWVFVLGGAAIGNEAGAFVGMILGWLLALGWFVFAIIKALTFIVQAVGLA